MRIFVVVALCFLWFGSDAIANQNATKSADDGACTDATAYIPKSDETWIAGSTTAMAITGNILISKTQIRFGNGVTAQLRYLGNIKQDSAKKYPIFRDVGCVAIYAVDPPLTDEMISGNRLCGFHASAGQPPDAALYLAAGVSDGGKWLTLAPYSKGEEEILHSSLSGQLCGTFGFFRE